MIKLKISALFILLLSCFVQASAIDKTITMCNDCHGKLGVSSDSDIPTIAGYSDVTISDMLAAYIDDTRNARSSKFRHGDTSRAETDMKTIAKKLSEEDIEQIANYYSTKKFVPSKQDFNAQLAEKGAKSHEKRCVKCHEEGGSSADDDTGILAGQWMEYLKLSFKDYRSGDRQTEDEMQKKINALSDEQVEELIHFYASQQ